MRTRRRKKERMYGFKKSAIPNTTPVFQKQTSFLKKDIYICKKEKSREKRKNIVKKNLNLSIFKRFL
jgi:hypothetical protein